jgi:hypothetical protein
VRAGRLRSEPRFHEGLDDAGRIVVAGVYLLVDSWHIVESDSEERVSKDRAYIVLLPVRDEQIGRQELLRKHVIVPASCITGACGYLPRRTGFPSTNEEPEPDRCQ